MNTPTHFQSFYPLSSPQREIWFDQQLHAGLPLYHIGSYWTIAGPVEVSLFAQAIALEVARHDALRTVFLPAEPLPHQTFSPHVKGELVYQDFSQAPDAEEQAQAWMRAEFMKPFELYHKPLWYFALLKMTPNRYYWFQKYHHLILDGYAMALFCQRVVATYQTLLTPTSEVWVSSEVLIADLSSGPSYIHFLTEDQHYLTSERYLKDHAYWQSKIREWPVASPYLWRRAPAHLSEQTTLVIDLATYQQLTEFAQSLKATTFHFWLGLWYVYFVRTYQQHEWTVGLPVLNRSTATLKEMVGLCTGIFPARFPCGTDLNFTELLAAIGGHLRQDYRHQRFPYGHLQRLVTAEGTPRLFDVVFSYEPHHYPTTVAGAETQVTMCLHNAERQALAIFVREFQAGKPVRIDFNYNVAAFQAWDMELLKTRLLHLLTEVQRHPNLPIKQLQWLPPAERHQLTVTWNDTAAVYPHDKCVHHFFEEQAERTPDHSAVVFNQQQLSYRDLNQRATQLARYLQTLNVGPEVLVGLYMERSLAMLVGLLAIWKAGGAYIPLDPHYPPERLQFMVEDSQVTILLTQQTVNVFPTLRLPLTTVTLDSDGQPFVTSLGHGHAAVTPSAPLSSSSLAYVIYTSGSTGQPKGVLVEHRGLCNVITAQRRLFHLSAADRVLQFSSLNFDAATFEIWLAWGAGASLYLGTREELAPGEPLRRFLTQQQITAATLTPSALAALPVSELPALQTLMVAGEACPASLVTQWATGRRFFNLYGPTEVTIWATAYQCRVAGIHSPPPIGQPILNTQVYILDQENNLTPIGVPGELHIGGVGVARGYLNRPDLTQTKFIPNPFGEGRLYKTGDLARWLADGNLEFLDRLDQQVKLRGFRIELGEIETTLTQHEAVKEAVVVLRDQATNPKLAAYVTLATVETPNFEDLSGFSTTLRTWLSTRLPNQMIPASITVLEKLPLTPNGKIDRQALPAPSDLRPRTAEDLIKPSTATELAIAGIWQEVLNRSDLSINDDFFTLGGHSLLAMQVIARLREVYQIELPLRTLFQESTLAKLAVHLETLLLTRELQQPLSTAEVREEIML